MQFDVFFSYAIMTNINKSRVQVSFFNFEIYMHLRIFVTAKNQTLPFRTTLSAITSFLLKRQNEACNVANTLKTLHMLFLQQVLVS